MRVKYHQADRGGARDMIERQRYGEFGCWQPGLHITNNQIINAPNSTKMKFSYYLVHHELEFGKHKCN